MTSLSKPGHNTKAKVMLNSELKDQGTKTLLWALYEDAASRFQPSQPDIVAGMTILSDLMEKRALSSQPFLLAMAHTLMAINTAYTIDDWCGRKVLHLQKTGDVLKDLQAKHGAQCQGCMYVQVKVRAGKRIDQEDSSECACMMRLDKVCEDEIVAIRTFNWTSRDGKEEKVD